MISIILQYIDLLAYDLNKYSIVVEYLNEEEKEIIRKKTKKI